MTKRVFFMGVILLIQYLGIAQNKFLFDYNDGLSNSLINQIAQDQNGFIWVATEDGLNRFDGINFLNFAEDKTSDFSLNNNFVTSLVEDHNRKLWVGQVDGLQYYNPETESFFDINIEATDSRVHHFISSMLVAKNGDVWITTSGYGLMFIDGKTGQSKYLTQLSEKLCSKNLRCIFEDSAGLFWIGSDNRGLNSYDPKTEKVESYHKSALAGKKLASNNIACITEGEYGHIYLGSLNGGLTHINKHNGKIETIQHNRQKSSNLPVKTLLFDSKKRLWVGTDGFGLKLLNKENNELETYIPDEAPFDFSNAKVHTLIEDNAENIWAGIYQKGLFLLPEKNKIFNHIGYSAFGENSIGSNSVTSIQGTANTLWLGTDGDGIYKIDRLTNKVEHIVLRNVQGEKEGNNIISLHNTSDYLWVGTYLNGLIQYNKKTGNTRAFKYNPTDEYSLVNDKVVTIAEDANGTIWLGTLGGGICCYDATTDRFYSGFKELGKENNTIPQWINHIFIDEKGSFWLGTYVGLFMVNPKEKQVVQFSETDNTLINNTVFSTQADRSGNIWVGTYGGLVKIQPESFETKSYSTLDGLCNNVICGIEEDEFGQIWISTHNGLSRLNPVTEEFTNFYASDGVQANEFARNSSYHSSTRELFFGGINGITEIQRDYAKYSRQIRDVMLTDFMLFNKPVKIGEKSGRKVILNKSIVNADTVKLKETDNFFSIGFTSVELAVQSRISYEYKMDGFDADWISTNSRTRRATYTNLSHGRYVFRVRGVDKSQRSSERVLHIIIYSPWYKTVWAKFLWIILSLVILIGLVLLAKETIQRRHLEKMNEMKMQFFINISHELKTPLSLILDPIEKLMAQNKNKDNHFYEIIHQNASRIFRLVNQLMDVRKIDKGILLVKFQETNLFNFVTEVASSYEILADSKSIDFSIKSEDEGLLVWIDPLNFEKIISNLLSNAFKFTPSGGEVKIRISKVKNRVSITMQDSGPGIKKSEMERIFNRFHQVKEANHPGGTGIGLHLSRQLAEIHKGTLNVLNRSEGQGSIFVLEIPLGNEHLPQKDLVVKENIIPTPSRKFVPQYLQNDEENDQKASTKPKTNYKVMVVEDENKIRDYLAGELAALYAVVTCENGKTAFERLDDEKPDLIISDIMMPEMDGISLCKKIKNNIKYSHIPVILLSALSSDEKKVEGIETGADMYLTKPFNSEFLKTTVASILENRYKLFEQIRKEKGYYDIENIKMDSHDEILMQKVMTIVKDNIADGNLNVEMLADGVGISRVHMHRKLKEITNQSARDFIKDIRMKQASYLLANKQVNVSEVAYAIGYSNLSHFSNTFKSYYGVSPKEYVARQIG